MAQSEMFHFQTVFGVNWVESDHLEIKPQRPTSISNNEISLLSEILGITSNLTNLVLDFKYCKAITDDGFYEIRESLAKLPNLTKLHLNLTECEKMSDTSIENLMEVVVKKKSLEEFHLILEGCMNISSIGLYSVIDSLKHLTQLSLLELTLSGISDPLMENLAQSLSPLGRLKCLILRFGAQHTKYGSLSNKGFRLMAQTLENLQDLNHFSIDIYRGDWSVTDDGLSRLKDALKKLAKLQNLRLNLRGLENVTQVGVAYINEALSQLLNLQKLHLNFKSVNEASTIQLKVPISILVHLKHLHLDFSWGVSDNTISELQKAFSKLKELNYLYLNFSGCEDLTETGISILKEIIINLPSLNNLHLEFPWCTRLDDLALQKLAEGISEAKKLTSLNLNFERSGNINDSLTDVGVMALIQSFRSLKALQTLKLNFANCLTLTNQILLAMKDALGQMDNLAKITLDIRLCEQIGDEGANYLREGIETHQSLNHVILNFMWCDKISDKCVEQILKLKKSRDLAQVLVAFQRRENQVEEESTTCQIF